METSASFEARLAPLSYPTPRINRPNCLILNRFTRIQGQAEFDRFIYVIRPKPSFLRQLPIGGESVDGSAEHVGRILGDQAGADHPALDSLMSSVKDASGPRKG